MKRTLLSILLLLLIWPLACGESPGDTADGSCELDGQSFAEGESVPDDCNDCICEDGDIICTDLDCEADDSGQ